MRGDESEYQPLVDDAGTSTRTSWGGGEVVVVTKDGANIQEVKHDGTTTLITTASVTKAVGPFRLIAVLFFLAYGGSYGVEGAVANGPPLFVLTSFLVAPFIWSLPEALVTAELSSAIPSYGGNILWAKRAFGDFFSWQSGFWTLLSIMSVATYPVIFFSFVQQIAHQVQIPFVCQMLIHLAMVVFISIVNIVGVKSVSGGNIVFSLFVMSPFFCLVVIGLTKQILSWDVITSTAWDGTINWRPLVTTAIWSCGGYTSVGQIAGDIHRPQRSFPVAILSVIGLTLFFSLLPLATAICVNPHQSAWVTFKVGVWAQIAQEVGGEWLHFLMAFGGMLSSLGEMNSVFCAYSRMISYLASIDDFFVPKFFAKLHPKFNTPYIAVISLGIFTLVLSLTPFQSIISFVVFLASISLIITFACLIKLRISEPQLTRPFVIPLGKFGLIYACGVGISISVFNIVIAPLVAQISGLCLVLLGVLIYYTMMYIRKSKKRFGVFGKL